LFDRGDLAGLRAELSQASKYRLIIDEIERLPPQARILEIGSSRGHLTCYFILAGRQITGVDVSPTAVAAAVEAFGDHFMHPDDPLIDEQAPYDLVFHVGTIGCVSDPVAMTRRCLELLGPGGRLLFNAPNRNALNLNSQLWFESAPPPDVVTLFAPGFWRDHFWDVAVVSEQVELCGPEQNFLFWLRRLARRRWRKPLPMSLKDSEMFPKAVSSLGDTTWRTFERVLGKVARITGINGFAPRHPTEYGLFVTMVKKR